MKKHLFLMSMAAACCLASCSEDKKDVSGNDENPIEVQMEPQRTEDEITRTTSRPAVVLGTNFEGVSKHFVDRLNVKLAPTPSNIAKAEIVVVDCNEAETFDASMLEALYAVYTSDSTYVMWAEPSKTADRMLTAKFEALENPGTSYNIPSTFNAYIEEDDDNMPYADFVVTHDGDMYIASDFEDHDRNTLKIHIKEYEDTEEGDGSVVPDTLEYFEDMEDCHSTPYQMGLAAETMIDWIESISEPVQTRAEAKDILNAQNVRLIVPVSNVVGNTHRKSVSYMYLQIWAAYDFKEDADVIMFQQTAMCYNEQLRYSLNEKAGYVTKMDGREWLNNGPFMKSVNCSARLHDAKYDLIDPKPATTIKSTSVTSGFSVNFGGNVGKNASGLMGGISGGFTFSKSNSFSQPELTIENRCSANEVRWSYNGPDHRWEFHFFKGGFTHTIPAKFQTGTFSDMCNTWIWKIPHPSGVYSMTASMEEILANRLANSWGTRKRDLDIPSKNTTTFHINPPSRSIQMVETYVEVDINHPIHKMLAMYKEEYFTQQKIFDFSDNSTKAVDEYVKTIKDKFEGAKEQWKKAGLNELFQFSVYRNNKKYTTFTIDCRTK